jgi:hypothetical protein
MLDAIVAAILQAILLYPMILAVTFVTVIIVPKVTYAVPFILIGVAANYMWLTLLSFVPFGDFPPADDMIFGTVVLASSFALALIGRFLSGGEGDSSGSFDFDMNDPAHPLNIANPTNPASPLYIHPPQN